MFPSAVKEGIYKYFMTYKETLAAPKNEISGRN